jgi:acyl-CoA thioesterase
MDAAAWLGLHPTHNPHRWFLPVTEGIATGGRFLFGGCGLGAAVAAMEASTERPVVWATAQYLSFAMVEEVVDLDVTVAVAGHRTTQARAVAKVGDREILTVNAALGHRELPNRGQWVDWPGVPGPDECPQRPPRLHDDRSIMTRQDMRLAKGRQWDELEGNPVEDGRTALWVRMPTSEATSIDLSAATLAILGDYVPFGISQSQGMWLPSNSLDNTLRVIRLVPTEWALVDIRAEGLANGFGHGTVYIWSEDRTLLAAASQSALVREQRPLGP